MVWDTFKAVILGIFISQKVYLSKKTQAARDMLLKEIAGLEAMRKATGKKKIKHELDVKLSDLQLLETSQAAKSLLHAKQRIFEFRDKPNKQLSKNLAQKNITQPLLEVMYAENGELSTISDKLQGFVGYYNHLYESSYPLKMDCRCFLDPINLPVLTVD